MTERPTTEQPTPERSSDPSGTERPGRSPDRHETPRVVVGVDGSPGSLAALDWATAEAVRRDATLHIVVVREPAGDPAETEQDRANVAGKRVREALHRVLGRLPHPDRAMSSTPDAPAGPALVEAAEGADLFVLGTTYLDHKPGPGAVTTYCVQHARGPLVLVPAPEPHHRA